VLSPILASTRGRIAALRDRSDEVHAAARRAGPVRPFEAALRADGLQVVAEIKRRSPSAGPIAPGLDAVVQADRYVDGGAAAISVLTEPDFFDGSLHDLEAVRRKVSVPVLRKDFVLDPVQVWEARASGADAVLLIVAALDEQALRSLLATAGAAGMGALVEVHTEDEARVAVDCGASIIGVNNRDLETFRTDLATAERIARVLPEGRCLVAESGVSDEAGAARMAACGYDAILVGEALVRADEPAALIERLSAAGRR
jgi:indole-3-glycerol phosphate synthase